MYLEYFQLKKEPFHITPDPEFLFLSPSHKEALASIIYGIEKKKGFVAVTGAVGVGKTTVLRSYLETVDRRSTHAVYIFNPNLSFRSLLHTVLQELDADVKTNDVFEMVGRLHQVLIGQYEKNRNIVLVIDEAQNIPVLTLENLRLLSNLETAKEKLIQIVLIGQPEFEEMLSKHALRQINQRIAIRSVILPLTTAESAAYIRHRLQKAGAESETIFSRWAVRKIIKEAEGVPRKINIICDNALITAFGRQKKTVSAKTASEVISDLKGKKREASFRWGYAAGALAAAVPILWFAAGDLHFIGNRGEENKTAQVEATHHQAPVSAEEKEESTAPPGAAVSPVASVSSGAAAPGAGTAATHVKPGKYPVNRLVKKGDNLSTLTRKIYGFTDFRLMENVKKENPSIKNIHRIYVGDEIIFPELDSGSKGSKPTRSR